MLMRVQAEITRQQVRQLKELRAMTGMRTTQKEAFASAMDVWSWALEMKAKGYAIVAIGKDGRSVDKFRNRILDAVEPD